MRTYKVGEAVTIVAPHLAPFTGHSGPVTKTEERGLDREQLLTVLLPEGYVTCEAADVAPVGSKSAMILDRVMPEPESAPDDGTSPEPGPEPEPESISAAELRRMIGMSAVALKPLGEDNAVPLGAIGMICAVEGKGAREPKLTLCFVSIKGDPRSGLLLVRDVGQDDIAPALSIRERRRWKG